MSEERDRRAERRAEMERRTDRAFAAAPRWRTRARRRALVVLAAVLLLAAAVWGHADPRDLLVAFAGLVAVALVAVALRVLTRAVAETGVDRLDERDRALRDAAWARAYVVAAVLLLALVGYAAATAGLPGIGERVVRVGALLVLAAAVAPTLAVAWILPDDDPADLDDALSTAPVDGGR